MARFISFGNKLLMEVDFISAIKHDGENEITISWKDGTEQTWDCTIPQWDKLRAFLIAQGMVMEVG